MNGRTLLLVVGVVVTSTFLIGVSILMLPLLILVPIIGVGAEEAEVRSSTKVEAVPGVDTVLLEAYQNAVEHAPKGCTGLRWQILAGIAQVESTQAAGSKIDAAGNVRPKIIGPALDGSGAGGNTSPIADTDGGKYDDDDAFDRAVGVLQFIPTSWEVFSTKPHNADGNGDGKADPHNVFDNARAAVNHLCAAAKDFGEGPDLRTALFAYNASHSYVDSVTVAIDKFDAIEVKKQPGGNPQGKCDVDKDLPRPNRLSCEEAVKKAFGMINGPCDYYRLCLGAVAVAYGWGVSGSYSAVTHWESLKAAGVAHEGDRNPPVGALLFWTSDSYGHVAIYVGGGKIVSNDVLRSGCMDVVDWDAPETQWGQPYLGWTTPYFPDGGGRS